MTNFGSIAGGLIWVAVASLLMLASLTPASADAAAFTACPTKAVKTAPLCMDVMAGVAKDCPVFVA